MFVVRGRGGQYREKLVMSVTVFVIRVWWRAVERGTDTECYCVYCEGLGRVVYIGSDTEC